MSLVNFELGNANTAQLNMNNTALRALFGKVGSGTTISMSDGSGKSSFTVLNPITGLSSVYLQADVSVPDGCYIYVNLYTNATYDIETFDGSTNIVTGNWGTPTTTNIGSLYWVKFTRVITTAVIGDANALATTGWMQLSSTRTLYVEAGLSGNGGTADATYRIEIASDSAGTTIVSTTNDLRLRAQASN
jgi:hypothetical protein